MEEKQKSKCEMYYDSYYINTKNKGGKPLSFEEWMEMNELSNKEKKSTKDKKRLDKLMLKQYNKECS